jgi:hypothetical protein
MESADGWIDRLYAASSTYPEEFSMRTFNFLNEKDYLWTEAGDVVRRERKATSRSEGHHRISSHREEGLTRLLCLRSALTFTGTNPYTALDVLSWPPFALGFFAS